MEEISSLSTIFKYIVQTETEPDDIILCSSDLNEINNRTNLSDNNRDANQIIIDGKKYLLNNISVQLVPEASTDFIPNQTGVKNTYNVIITIVIFLFIEKD
jgi:hypothetical protein